MYHLRLVRQFARASAQNELAYRANFWLSLFHSVLNLATGVLGVLVIFGQIETIRGWDLPSTLALLGVYLTLSALRGLFIGPSLEALAGIDGEIWNGQFDFTLLRPVNAQFLASVRHWRPFALVDLALGLGVLAVAVAQLGQSLAPLRLATFLLALLIGVAILYAILLAFSALTVLNTSSEPIISLSSSPSLGLWRPVATSIRIFSLDMPDPSRHSMIGGRIVPLGTGLVMSQMSMQALFFPAARAPRV